VTEVSGDTTSGAVLLGRVFLSRAFKSESAGDLSRVLRQVAGARREAGRPILCFMIVDPDAEVPSEAGRQTLHRATVSLLNYCESLTLVVEGDALKRTLIRTVLRGMATLGGNSLRIRVVDHLEAAARLAGEPELELPELQRRGLEAGVWDLPSAVVASEA
jgi:hypothetical protein